MMKKVLIIVENMSVPLDTRVRKEAFSLQENGYCVSVICPKWKENSKTYELLNGVHIYRHPMPKEGNGLGGYLLEYCSALFWQCLYAWWIYFRRGFQVIQGCNPPDDIFLVAVPFKVLGVKYIFDHHDATPELYLAKFGKSGFFYRVQAWLEKMTYRFSDVVMATNASYRDLAMTRGAISPEDAFIVRNGPDLEVFKPVPTNDALKHGKRFLVGYVGHMSVQEGLDILLDVAAHIKALGRHDNHFTCVGGGPGLAGLRKMNHDKNLEDMVNFTGRISDHDLLEILSTADVCVNPDKPSEMNDISTMIKIMEYMALGKPIVQFDSKEGRFSAQEASLYGDTANQVSDFANKILWLLDNPAERKRMGEFGRKRVEEQLAWKYSVPHMLAAYGRAFNKRSRQATAESARDRPLVENKLRPQESANHLFSDYYRVPEGALGRVCVPELSGDSGFFRFGPNAICYGQCASGVSVHVKDSANHDASKGTSIIESGIRLTFDPNQVIDNLRKEHYLKGLVPSRERFVTQEWVRKCYYFVREFLPVSVRRYMQRAYFSDWTRRPFPSWPVDFTADMLHEELLRLSMEAAGIQKVPFIWFWPEGAPSCAIMTHDVETADGRDFTSDLMALDEAYGVRASFQVIPERRYDVPPEYVQEIKKRGFEFNIHDLNHDGNLYQEHGEFRRRAATINAYARKYNSRGFRAGSMYRNLDWYDAFDFSYDMSVPSVAHLEPKRGGCCTVMPYFIGNILELPLTMIQDYSLFHILGDYSTDFWKYQIDLILQRNGLISFIIHPDYMIEKRARRVYEELLRYLTQLRDQQRLWFALPGEVDRWWRARSQMKLVPTDDGWKIEGPGSDRARLAYATLDAGRVTYALEDASKPMVQPHTTGLYSV